jgi:hypothetical protein
MGSAAKKLSIDTGGVDYEAKFDVVRKAAEAFENLDRKSRSSLSDALAKIFDFGEQICQETDAFERFLTARGTKFNKAAQAKPYHALVSLAFSDTCGKSWRSEMTTVLSYAAETKGRQPIREWLQQKSISDWYAEAVKHNHRTSETKNQKRRSSQLQMITRELETTRIVTQALPGLNLKAGFSRSLIFTDGGQSFLVHVREDDNPKTIENYLLELARGKKPIEHPLSERPLYKLFRAVDLIAGTCFTSHKKSVQLIVVWNEESEGGRVTRLRFLSSLRSFTNATVTLSTAISELDGKGQVAFEASDAETFRDLFQHDYNWEIASEGDSVSLIDNAPASSKIELSPISRYLGSKLRQGGELGRKTRHFRATCEGMKASTDNLETARLLAKGLGSAPDRLQWIVRGNSIVAGFENARGFDKLKYDFLEFAEPAPPVDDQMELLLRDIEAFWKVTSAYGEDLAGYFADTNVDDAAFCIDHLFTDGDQFEYVSPMVLGVSMTRTQVCKDFVASAVLPPAI